MSELKTKIKNMQPPPAVLEEGNKNLIQKKKCGRKRDREVDDDMIKEHNKYSDDNLRTRIKYLLLKNLLNFINKKILDIYNNNIGKGIFKKELQTLNPKQQSNPDINFNRKFLTKTLDEIFSEKISTRYTTYPPDLNKIIIERLKNEKDENKRNYFNKLFKITFLECLNHFIGKKKINELDGLKTFNDIKDEIAETYEDGDEYIYILENYLNDFEDILKMKRPRQKKKNIYIYIPTTNSIN